MTAASPERFRERAACWLAGFDTRLIEVGLAGSTIINGVQAAARDQHKAPLAPFLNSALWYLSHHPLLRNVILVVAGLVQLGALAWGTGAGVVRPRIWMAFISMALWWVVVAAIVTGQRPTLTAARYAWAASLSLFIYVALSVQSVSVRRRPQRRSKNSKGADDATT